MTVIIDPDHPGLYLTDDPSLTADPDHPGFYLHDNVGLVADPDHPGFYLYSDVPAEPLIPDVITGSTTVSTGILVTSPLTPLKPAPVEGVTTVTVNLITGADHIIELGPIESITDIRILSFPNIRNHTPILLAFSAQLRLESSEPIVST